MDTACSQTEKPCDGGSSKHRRAQIEPAPAPTVRSETGRRLKKTDSPWASLLNNKGAVNFRLGPAHCLNISFNDFRQASQFYLQTHPNLGTFGLHAAPLLSERVSERVCESVCERVSKRVTVGECESECVGACAIG